MGRRGICICFLMSFLLFVCLPSLFPLGHLSPLYCHLSLSSAHPPDPAPSSGPSSHPLPPTSLLPYIVPCLFRLPARSLLLPAPLPFFWSNDSRLSTACRLFWPPSRLDGGTDEIAHRMPLSGQSWVKAILDGGCSLLFIHYISFFFSLRVYVCVCIHVCVFISSSMFCFVLFLSLMILIQKEFVYLANPFSPPMMPLGYLEANHHLNIRSVSCIRGKKCLCFIQYF